MSDKLYAIYKWVETGGGSGLETLSLYSDENGTPTTTGTLLGTWSGNPGMPPMRNSSTSWNHTLSGSGETTGTVTLYMVNAGTENAYFYFDLDGTRHAFDASELALTDHATMNAFAEYNTAEAAAEEFDTDPTAGPEKRYLYYKIVKHDGGTETHELKLYTDTHGTPGTTGTLVHEWNWGAVMGHSFNPSEKSWTDSFYDNSGTQQVEVIEAGNQQDLIRLVYDGETIYFRNPGTILYGPGSGLDSGGTYNGYGMGNYLPEWAPAEIPVKSYLALGQDPVLPEHAARKSFVETKIASAISTLSAGLGTASAAAGSSLLYGASGTFTGDGSTTTFTLALQDSNGTAVGKEGVIQLYEVGSNNVLTPVETATEVTFVANTSWQVKYAFATAPANGTTYKAVLSLLTPYAQSSNETLVLAAPSA